MDTDTTIRETDLLDLLGHKWTPEIVTHLRADSHRFNELKRSIDDVPGNTLSVRLKELEAAGVVSRTVVTTSPPRVRYELTHRGRAFVELLDEIRRL